MLKKILGAVVVIVVIFALVDLYKKFDNWRDSDLRVKRPFAIGNFKPQTPQGAILTGQKLDINTVDETALEILPNIGPKLAKEIVNYRKYHGPFKSFDELDNVKGVGPKKLELLRQYFK